MKKPTLVDVLLARALAAQTELEWSMLCGDIDTWFVKDKITFEEHELLYKLIDRLYK